MTDPNKDRPWVVLEHPHPPRVKDRYEYWGERPPVISERCLYWMRQIEAGWQPNRHIRGEGYDGSAEWFGVYLWEYLHVLYPLLRD